MPTGRIEELQDGFIIEIAGLGARRPTRVTMEPTGFHIEPLECRQLELFDNLGHRCNMGRPFKPQTTLVDHRRLVDLVMDQLLPRGYAGPGNHWRQLPGRRGEACRSLAKRIYAQWLRLVNEADPTIRRVQHAVYLQDHKPASLLHKLGLYQDKYLVSDICNYPAAAMSVLIANELAEVRDYNLSRQRGCPPGQFYFGSSTAAAESPTRELAALLANWQGLYSPTGRSCRRRAAMCWCRPRCTATGGRFRFRVGWPGPAPKPSWQR